MSHGEKQIGDKLLALMARQLKLSRRELIELVECSLSEEDYLMLLRAKRAIS